MLTTSLFERSLIISWEYHANLDSFRDLEPLLFYELKKRGCSKKTIIISFVAIVLAANMILVPIPAVLAADPNTVSFENSPGGILMGYRS